jgi:hypothetical protein
MDSSFLRLRIVAGNTNNVIAGELICMLWDHWQMQRELRMNTLSESIDQKHTKLSTSFESHQSTLKNSRVPTSTVLEDRYMLSPLRL